MDSSKLEQLVKLQCPRSCLTNDGFYEGFAGYYAAAQLIISSATDNERLTIYRFMLQERKAQRQNRMSIVYGVWISHTLLGTLDELVLPPTTYKGGPINWRSVGQKHPPPEDFDHDIHLCDTLAGLMRLE